MIDRQIIRRLLQVLELVDTTLGLREDILLDQIAAESTRHVEADQIVAHLKECERKLWVANIKDDLGGNRWKISPGGILALKHI
jgi:hypothetical protein